MKSFVMSLVVMFAMVTGAFATDCSNHCDNVQQVRVQRVVNAYPQRVVVRQEFVEVPAYEVQQVVVQKQKVQRQRVLGGRSRSFKIERSVQR